MKIAKLKKSITLTGVIVFGAASIATSTAYAQKGTGQDIQSSLDDVEASHLTFMREEEKLARDVYLKFAEWYPDQPVFNTIATRSEQTHTDTLRDKLDQYGLPDPNSDSKYSFTPST